mmetsp:Transcript_15616/g.61030  ORF Transcript_15616/g.61030 Transcript_15616/m.61030 type:complete len:479 (-) Transcript_15616:428-1864(-)
MGQEEQTSRSPSPAIVPASSPLFGFPNDPQLNDVYQSFAQQQAGRKMAACQPMAQQMGCQPEWYQPPPVPFFALDGQVPMPQHKQPQFRRLAPQSPGAPYMQMRENLISRRRCEASDKSRVASLRRRDAKGQFLKKEVAIHLEQLETKLQTRDEECFSLRQQLEEKDRELKELQRALEEQRVLNQRLLHARQQSYSYAEAPPVNLTSRNYVLGPTVNPCTSTMFVSESRKPFTEKIDYMKVLDNLRRTQSSQTIDEEKKGAISSQEEWEQRQQFNAFMRKMEEEKRWRDIIESEQRAMAVSADGQRTVYQQPGKIGNQMLPAFTTKVDLSTAREELGKKRQGPQDDCSQGQGQGQQQEHKEAEESEQRLAEQIHMEQMKRIMQEVEQRRLDESPDMDIMMSPGWEQMMSPDTCGMDIDQANFSSPSTARSGLGGPPSNIYTPPTKIGNLPVKAFTSKIDLSEIELRKTGRVLSTSPPL